jgi:hypothetical protein
MSYDLALGAILTALAFLFSMRVKPPTAHDRTLEELLEREAELVKEIEALRMAVRDCSRRTSGCP